MATTSETESKASAHDIFLDTQKQFFENWSKAATAFQQNLQAATVGPRLAENAHQISHLYDTWKEATGKYLDVLMNASPACAGTDTASKLFRATDAYTKLYEFWEPLATAFQEKALDPAAYRQLLDPAKYKETIDKIFGFGSSSDTASLFGHGSELLETWGSKGELFLRPWTDAMRTSIDASLRAASTDPDPEAGAQVFRSFYSAFERTFGKVLNMPAVGKDREYVELVSKTIDRYTDFAAKNSELQRQMQSIAQHAMEKVVENMAQKVREGEQIEEFGQFVSLWTKTNEQAFLEFFQTDQFSQLQSLVLDSALECRRQFHRLIELCLKDYPIVLRSEMDDVCKTTYRLNKTVRALGKKSSETEQLRKELGRLKRKVTALEKKLSSTN